MCPDHECKSSGEESKLVQMGMHPSQLCSGEKGKYTALKITYICVIVRSRERKKRLSQSSLTAVRVRGIKWPE